MSSSVNRNRGPTMDSRAPCSVDWSKLPDELWHRIGQQLKPFIERLRFRSVSYSWRHSIPRFHPSIPTEFPYPFSFHSKASLARTTLHLLRTNPFPYASTSSPSSSSSSPKGWLLKLEECNQNLRLLHPITNRQLRCGEDFYPEQLNFLNYKIVELGQAYTLKNSAGSAYVDRVSKVIELPHSEPCSILVIHHKGKLGFAQNGDERLRSIGNRFSSYSDLIVYKGRPYVVDKWGTVFLVDPTLGVVQFAPRLVCFGHKKHLVESCGDLYLVDRYMVADPNARPDPVTSFYRFIRYQGNGWPDAIDECPLNTVNFRVYKLDQERGRWDEVQNLDDQAFFLNVDFSFSVSAEDIVGCSRNCIYFSDHRENPLALRSLSTVGDGSVFNLADHSISVVNAAGAPFFAEIYWPSPP
ncbi:PREDICTED: uncharacterized protein At1g65760-like [Prunus mume]|uniref:Uncharacterized protein At1g65760-like n=1 Tax=Prunus mume TaxID=102107 RepID=A0ABM0PN51_PRUMU|nr:PREDICTED: uncharacterized protein At1g65760-like [Prunus mume]